MARCGQQDQAAVAEQVVSVREWHQAWVSERFRLDHGPAQPVEFDVVVQEAPQGWQRPFDGGPFQVADQDPGVAEFGQPADVVVVEVGQSNGVYVVDVMANRRERRVSVWSGPMSNRLSRS